MFRDRLRSALIVTYKAAPPPQRLDHAERLERLALRWLQEDAHPDDFDAEAVSALCLMLPLRERLLAEFNLKSGAEAAFAESGWTAVRVREIMRSLERLPDKPKSSEEKWIADADTVLRLGLLGFARHASAAALAGENVGELGPRLRAALGRRLYTPQGHREAGPLREELRVLMERLEKAREAGLG